jgi:hypothetical protein
MADNANHWQFKRRLDKNFIQQLERLATSPGWFADVLADRDLILGVRDNYLNVYWHGQSLFKIEPGRSDPKVSTHPKYLVNPKLSKAVKLKGRDFDVAGHEALIAHYDGPETLKMMKKAADLYCGDEKKGVHNLIRANTVIDTEVAFNNTNREDEEERLLPRMDMACLEEGKDGIRLCFWEAKLYRNGEIRAEKDTRPPVLTQVRQYRELVEKHRHEMIQSYRDVAKNLVAIAGWAGRKPGDLIEKLADGTMSLAIGDPPAVGLVIYDFGGAEKNSARFKKEMAKLKEGEPSMPIRCIGAPKGFKLSTLE